MGQELTAIDGSYCSFISVSMATVWRETGQEDQGAAVWSLLHLIKASELSGSGGGGVRYGASRPPSWTETRSCLASSSDQNSLRQIHQSRQVRRSSHADGMDG